MSSVSAAPGLQVSWAQQQLRWWSRIGLGPIPAFAVWKLGLGAGSWTAQEAPSTNLKNHEDALSLTFPARLLPSRLSGSEYPAVG